MNCFQIIIFVTSETTMGVWVIHNIKLWIAFKLLSLWRQKQQHHRETALKLRCELLSNYYLCDVRNNVCANSVVVAMLWIAFKLLSLWRQKQQDTFKGLTRYGCELLSNYYLCDVRNNNAEIEKQVNGVVNCFQIIIFVTSETTLVNKLLVMKSLWIAFKLLSLWRQKQQICLKLLGSICCELLSNYYLCDVRNNVWRNRTRPRFVVNCFQIIIFVTSETTNNLNKLKCY